MSTLPIQNDFISSYNNSGKLHVPKPRRVIPVDVLINNWNRYDDEVLSANWWESKSPLPMMAKEEMLRYLYSNNTTSANLVPNQSNDRNNDGNHQEIERVKVSAPFVTTPEQVGSHVAYSM